MIVRDTIKEYFSNKNFTNRDIAIFGTIIFHIILIAFFTQIHLNKRERRLKPIVIEFMEPQRVDVEEREESESDLSSDERFLANLEKSLTNQASSRSNEMSVEDLRSSMKSLDEFRGELKNNDVDLFSKEAEKREIKLKHYADERKDGQGEEDRIVNNSYTGRSTIDYYLDSRYSDRVPTPIYTCLAAGTILVDIEVNREGLVTKARYNKRRSTSSDGCLIEEALNYAYKAKFNNDIEAEEIQKGYIIYFFAKRVM